MTEHEASRRALPGWAPGVGVGVAAAAACGLALRLVAPEAQAAARAAAAWLPVLGAGIVAAAVVRRTPAASVLATYAAAVAATLCAGAGLGGSLAAGFVACGSAAMALGLAALLRGLGVRPPAAALGAMALPALLAGAVFVADPFIEWSGSTPRSRTLAAWVLRANPIAAATSSAGGLGIDWQTMPLLYDGAGPGSPGLSVIGQYYPTRAPSPIWWGACAAACAVLLLGAAARVAPAAGAHEPDPGK